jgi:hypothetical protein
LPKAEVDWLSSHGLKTLTVWQRWWVDPKKEAKENG